MMSYSIYVVDDEQIAREGIALALKKNYQVKAFPSAGAAIEAMEDSPPDPVLLDIGLPDMSGIEGLEKIKRLYPDMIIITISGYEDVETVVSAMKHGAYDYLVKPLQMDALVVSVHNALESLSMG